MSSINLTTRFKNGMYLLNREKRYSTDIMQILNKLPTDKRQIKVPQDRLVCPIHADIKTKQVFEKILF